ncbi:MAG: hypothetical protein CL678_13245, partial [Bdellovibrionaceae bacterium]|nr:hypothetical protein [Pseudobdellovibrionaceae bacterium]
MFLKIYFSLILAGINLSQAVNPIDFLDPRLKKTYLQAIHSSLTTEAQDPIAKVRTQFDPDPY